MITQPMLFDIEPECDRVHSPRQQLKTIRLLRLIDFLASQRFPKTVAELHRLMVQETGQRWHPRTIRRDLEVISALGLLDESEHGFKINLQRSERLQTVALKLFP